MQVNVTDTISIQTILVSQLACAFISTAELNSKAEKDSFVSLLLAAPPIEQKQLLGKQIFPLIQKMLPGSRSALFHHLLLFTFDSDISFSFL